MKQYTREELIAELAQNVGCMFECYGTWIIKSHLGGRHYDKEHFVEVSYISHNEEDSIGIFDGETYNPQDYNEWLYGEFDPELEENDCIANYNEEELKEKFEDYCEAVWSDSANHDNYEPREARNARLAERLFDILVEDDRIAVCQDGYLVLTEEEAEILSDNNGYREDIYNGKLDEFSAVFEKWEDE